MAVVVPVPAVTVVAVARTAACSDPNTFSSRPALRWRRQTPVRQTVKHTRKGSEHDAFLSEHEAFLRTWRDGGRSNFANGKQSTGW